MAIRMCSYQRKPSFTLLELLLIIIILAVILGISIPSLKETIKQSNFRAFANKTYLFLDYAKTQSIALNEIIEVHFDFDDNVIVAVRKDIPDEVIEKARIPSDMDIVFEEDLIQFYPDGTLSEFSLVLTDRWHTHATIESEGFNGKLILSINEKD